jgi:DNA polymerase I
MKTIRFIGPERPFSNIPTGTKEECLEYCRSKTILGLDTETSGLDFTSKKLLMLQIGDADRQYVIDCRYVDPNFLLPVFEQRPMFVLHNAKFDYKFLLNHGLRLDKVWDTMLAENVRYCGRNDKSASLAATLERHFNIKLEKDERNQFIGMKGEPFTDKQIVYGAKDVVHLIRLKEVQKEKLEELQLISTIYLENRAVLAFADIEYNGLDIDKEEWLKISNQSEVALVGIKKSLDRIVLEDDVFKSVLPKYLQGDLFGDPDPVQILWSSPTQVKKVMQCIVPDIDDVNSKNLYFHRSRHALISIYIQYKEKSKLASSYGEEFLSNCLSDGRIHTSFKQILNTGRVSSKEPNMQQIPADNLFRNCFTAPEEWVFVSSDYSSQELNVIAYGSKDPVWLNALRFGQDLHSVCAELVYGDVWKNAAEEACAYYADMKNGFILDWDTKTMEKNQKAKCECPEHKKLRNNVKSINFGLAYGMGPSKLAHTLEISNKEAKDLIETYFKAFPAIRDFLTGLEKKGLKYGYAKTFAPFYRKRYFPGWFPGFEQIESNNELAASIGRAAKNTPIQGTSADMTKYAMYMIRREIIQNELPVKMVMTVHDQIDTICVKEYAEEWKVKMTEIMEKAALIVIQNGLLKAETEISEKWKK